MSGGNFRQRVIDVFDMALVAERPLGFPIRVRQRIRSRLLTVIGKPHHIEIPPSRVRCARRMRAVARQALITFDDALGPRVDVLVFSVSASSNGTSAAYDVAGDPPVGSTVPL